MKFHQNRSSGTRVVPLGRTDTTKLIMMFRNIANAPKNKLFCNVTATWAVQIYRPLKGARTASIFIPFLPWRWMHCVPGDKGKFLPDHTALPVITMLTGTPIKCVLACTTLSSTDLAGTAQSVWLGYRLQDRQIQVRIPAEEIGVLSIMFVAGWWRTWLSEVPNTPWKLFNISC